jgi:hypothetical protein
VLEQFLEKGSLNKANNVRQTEASQTEEAVLHRTSTAHRAMHTLLTSGVRTVPTAEIRASGSTCSQGVARWSNGMRE